MSIVNSLQSNKIVRNCLDVCKCIYRNRKSLKCVLNYVDRTLTSTCNGVHSLDVFLKQTTTIRSARRMCELQGDSVPAIFFWRMENFQLRVAADRSLHGANNCYKHMRDVDPYRYVTTHPTLSNHLRAVLGQRNPNSQLYGYEQLKSSARSCL